MSGLPSRVVVIGVDGSREREAALRFAAEEAQLRLTFLVKFVVQPATTTSRWTITSGTRAYKGLHGAGKEYENADHTVTILAGAVSRWQSTAFHALR